MSLRLPGTVLAVAVLSWPLAACGEDVTEDGPAVPTAPTSAHSSPSGGGTTPSPTEPAESPATDQPASGAPAPDVSTTATARPTPTTTAITEDMGPGEHDMDGE